MKIHLFFFILLFGVTILPAVSVYFQYRKTFLIFRPWYYRQIMSLVGLSDHMNVECNNLYMSYIFHEIFPLKDYLFTSARKKFPQYGSVDMRRECVKGNGRCKNQCHASEVRIAYCMRPGSLCCLQK